MERRLTEEQVTKAIMAWLEQDGWTIICFDFPQSGTGISVHPNETIQKSKNKGSFIPDIVAAKDAKVVFFENKDRFVLADFLKIDQLRKTDEYSHSIKRLLTEFEYDEIFYGIGLEPSSNAEQKTKEWLSKVDFVVFCDSDKGVKVHFDPQKIF